MAVLETIDNITKKQAEEFRDWFDLEINTEFSIEPSGDGEQYHFYCMCYDLEESEIDKTIEYLNEANIEYY